MPAKRLPTSPAVGRFLRDQRKRLGYTLREVEDFSRKSGKVIPLSTLARVEQGGLDPGLPRLQQLLRLYHVPLQAAGDLLDLEEFAGELPDERDPKRLYLMGRDAWQVGDARGALAAFIALQRLEPGPEPLIRQKALLAFASVAGALGKYRFSKHVIDGLLLEPPDDSILVSVLVQAAKCWQWLGNQVVALALVESACGRLSRESPAHQVAFAYHEKTSVLVGLGKYAAAQEALNASLRAYRGAKDEDGYCRALGLRAWMHFEKKDPAGALMAAQTARLYAQRHGIERSRLLYSIQEARAHLLLGNLTVCLSRLGQVLAASVETDDKVVRFYTHYYYWQTYEGLKDEGRAAAEFEAAARHLDYLDEVTEEAVHIRTLLAARRGTRGRRKRKD